MLLVIHPRAIDASGEDRIMNLWLLTLQTDRTHNKRHLEGYPAFITQVSVNRITYVRLLREWMAISYKSILIHAAQILSKVTCIIVCIDGRQKLELCVILYTTEFRYIQSLLQVLEPTD